MKSKDYIDLRVDRLHSKVEGYLKQGLSDAQIFENLKSENLEPYYIETIIENIKAEIEDRKSFRNSIIMGSFFIIIGLIINVLSYRISENISSSTFLLFWGIVVTGIVTIVRGFILYRK